MTPGNSSKQAAAFPFLLIKHMFSCHFFKIVRHFWISLFFPSSAVVFVNIYVHHRLPWLVLIRCCCGDSVSGVPGVGWVVLWSLVTGSLLRELWRLFLGFQSVYERLDAAFHACGHPSGHWVCRGRGGGTGALGGRPRHQTLLIPQLRRKRRGLVNFFFGGD